MYHDGLYGNFEVPSLVKDIIWSNAAARLRGISMSVLPNRLMPYGPMPSRFQHCMGVYYLADIVWRNNQNALKDYHPHLLAVAALLHDFGNPPFSHLGEFLLREIWGHNGESFLEVILEHPDFGLGMILNQHNISLSDVLTIVTGGEHPLTPVVHGSIDVDNIDNIFRYRHYSAFPAIPRYNPQFLAGAFRFHEKYGFCIQNKAFPSVRMWQKARSAVYGNVIYSDDHLRVVVMVAKALQIAYGSGALTKDFFFLDDERALDFLYSIHLDIRHILNRAYCFDFFDRAYGFETERPNAFFSSLVSHWRERERFSCCLATELGIPSWALAVYAGRGRDRRAITLPFLRVDGYFSKDRIEVVPLYRFRVFVDRSYRNLFPAITNLIRDRIEESD